MMVAKQTTNQLGAPGALQTPLYWKLHYAADTTFVKQLYGKQLVKYKLISCKITTSKAVKTFLEIVNSESKL